MEENQNKIEGIFNYCDRWCEKCTYTDQCRLFSDDQERIRKHIGNGEDPNDWDIVLSDLKEIFEKTFSMISEKAKEFGIDLDNLPEVEHNSVDPRDNPLLIASKKYMEQAHAFLKNLEKAIDKEKADLEERAEYLPNARSDAGTLNMIMSCHGIISWYHMQISVKLFRAFGKEEHDNEEMTAVDRYDADGSAMVSYNGLTRSIEALMKIHEWSVELQDEVLDLLLLADRMRRAIDRELPGHKQFVWPPVPLKIT